MKLSLCPVHFSAASTPLRTIRRSAIRCLTEQNKGQNQLIIRSSKTNQGKNSSACCTAMLLKNEQLVLQGIVCALIIETFG